MKWTNEQDEQIIELVRNGWVIDRIARFLGGGVTESLVSRRITALRKRGVAL